MDQHLSWDQHLEMLKQKLIRSNGLLAKVRYFLSLKLLKALYISNMAVKSGNSTVTII